MKTNNFARVIVDTQSNRLFTGVAFEQNYDQRGGLCQVGAGSIVVTTNPINPRYLLYWQSLGFSLPDFVIAGPHDPNFCLSELIMNNEFVQQDIAEILGDRDARLEFFCIEEAERQLAHKLGIWPYCNFDVAIPLSRKNNFKAMFDQIEILTPPWQSFNGKDQLVKYGKDMLNRGSILLKSVDGTGGIACHGMVKIDDPLGLMNTVNTLDEYGSEFIIEQIVADKADELSVHWEITEDRKIKILGIFSQLSDNFAYSGTKTAFLMPELREKIIEDLQLCLGPELIRRGALGYHCCDLIVDQAGEVYWIDLNPRKGAIIYVYSMVERLARIHSLGSEPFFFHKHCHVPAIAGQDAFEVIQSRLKPFLSPDLEQSFVVVTNPGVMEFGYVDITGISVESEAEARRIFEYALETLQGVA